MILEAIASYLQSKNVGKIGNDLFCYYMPPKIPRGYLIMTPNDGIHIDPELKGYYQDMFPFMIRAENVTKVNQLSTSVMAVLDVTDIDTKDVFFHYIRPISHPTIYPQNDGGSFEAGVVIEFSCFIK